MSAACSRSPKALTQVLLANRITRWDNTNDLSLCPRPRLRGVWAASGAGRISPAAPPRLLKRWAARLESQKALFFWGDGSAGGVENGIAPHLPCVTRRLCGVRASPARCRCLWLLRSRDFSPNPFSCHSWIHAASFPCSSWDRSHAKPARELR